MMLVMEFIFNVSAVIQMMSISLGVGASTVAITSFFVAIADGHMDATERRMLQPVYVILRVAMGLILATAILKALTEIITFGGSVITGSLLGIWTVIVVLFINAYLMTAHIMPSSFGPAIQAGSWYTLGFLTALISIGIANSYLVFLIGYGLFMAAVITFVNGMIVYLKIRRPAKPNLAD